MKHLKLLLLICLFSIPAYAAADIQEALTGLEIEEYFEENERLYTSEKPDVNAIIAFSKKHISKDYEYTQIIKDSRRLREREIKQSYEDAVNFKEFQDKELLNSKLSHDIQGIDYRDNRKAAIVRFSSVFNGDVKLPGENVNLPDDYAIVSFKTLSRCEAAFRLEDGILKTHRLDCHSDAIYDKAVPAKE